MSALRALVSTLADSNNAETTVIPDRDVMMHLV
jgi:hypothetical protein